MALMGNTEDCNESSCPLLSDCPEAATGLGAGRPWLFGRSSGGVPKGPCYRPLFLQNFAM